MILSIFFSIFFQGHYYGPIGAFLFALFSVTKTFLLKGLPGNRRGDTKISPADDRQGRIDRTECSGPRTPFSPTTTPPPETGRFRTLRGRVNRLHNPTRYSRGVVTRAVSENRETRPTVRGRENEIIPSAVSPRRRFDGGRSSAGDVLPRLRVSGSERVGYSSSRY